ncbi:MAG: S41 family peptidase [Candidatus Omnitrophota bacterium]
MRKKIIFISVLAFVFFASVSLAVSFDRKKRDDLYKQVEFFSDVLTIVDAEYVDEIKPKDMVYGALRGALSSLDPHSQFMDPDTYDELKVDTEGRFGGLGVEISIKDGLITVITPLEDTPAWKAGIKPGDKIIKINSELTRGMDLTAAMKKLRGKPGEMVNLTVMRGPDKELLEFKIIRAAIKINDIKTAEILEGGIGYIKVVEFRETTSKDFDNVFEKISKTGIKSLILDLRNNPGGLLESALDVTGKFLPKGKLIVFTKGRKENQNLIFNSNSEHPILNLPLAVLINEGSASGSEIVAAALQEYKRATILGVKSFGKGSVQTVIPLSDGSALRLTTSKYFTPSGKEIHGKGVIPDIIVEMQTSKEEQEIIEESGSDEKPDTNEKIRDYNSDPVIMSAVNLLKTQQ